MVVDTASLACSCLHGDLNWGPARLWWSVKAAGEHPGLSQGDPPLGLLHPEELGQLDRLCMLKRRCDWLVGRWTAKHLLQSTLHAGAGMWLPLNNFIVANDSSGAPYARLTADMAPMVGSDNERLPVSLSISHSGPYAFCAVGGQFPLPLNRTGVTLKRALCHVGADIERIEPRGGAFVTDYFTPAEIGQVNQAPPELRDLTVTAIWSAKEAVLKTLKLGLTVDTRWVSIYLNYDPFRQVLPDHWLQFQAQCDRRLLPVLGTTLVGWWRQVDDFVLTIAVSSDM